jgi:hypothetical protein
LLGSEFLRRNHGIIDFGTRTLCFEIGSRIYTLGAVPTILRVSLLSILLTLSDLPA